MDEHIIRDPVPFPLTWHRAFMIVMLMGFLAAAGVGWLADSMFAWVMAALSLLLAAMELPLMVPWLYTLSWSYARRQKLRTLNAHRSLYWRYRLWPIFAIFIGSSCPLCRIHAEPNGVFDIPDCRGCPQAGSRGGGGCVTKTYLRAKQQGDRFSYHARMEYHRRALEQIKEFPPEQFTKDGWKFFDLPKLVKEEEL